jgi:hypothetical protein
MHCVISCLAQVEVPIQLTAALCFALLNFSQRQESPVQFFCRNEMPPQNGSDQKKRSIHSNAERNEETKYSHCDMTCMCFYPVMWQRTPASSETGKVIQGVPFKTHCIQSYTWHQYCFLIGYLLKRIRNAKCLANSSRIFRRKVIFRNQSTFCSWIHPARTYRDPLRNWR